jgi:hypothetical protein
VQPYSAALVVEVAEAEGDAGGVFDEPVVRLGGGVGDAGVDEGEDLRPPRLDGLGQGGDSGDVGAGAPVVEREQPVADLGPGPSKSSER